MAAVCECPSARTRGARPDSTGACVTLARRLLRWLYHDYTHIGEALAGWCGGDVGAEQAHRGGSSVFTRGRTRNRRGLRVRKALPPRPTTLSTVRTMHTDVRARNKKKDRHATNRGDVPRALMLGRALCIVSLRSMLSFSRRCKAPLMLDMVLKGSTIIPRGHGTAELTRRGRVFAASVCWCYAARSGAARLGPCPCLSLWKRLGSQATTAEARLGG